MMRSKDQERASEFLLEYEARARKQRQSMFAVLKGGAGVGKTWVVGNWLKQVTGLNVVVCAPTNKAVDVLRRKCGQANVSFRTLDSYLGFRIKRNDDWEMERSRAGGVDDADLVVCDEGSMVKAEYHQELRYRRTAVLYVMDPYQLNPVGEGPSPSASVERSLQMDEVVRQAGDSPVLDITTYLRDRVIDNSHFTLSDLRAMSRKDARLTYTNVDNLHDWARSAINAKLDVRILSFQNARVNYHNAMMHRMMYPDDPLFGEGELALVNETFEYDDDTMLTNGELVRVLRCTLDKPIEGVEVYEVEVERLHVPALVVDGEEVRPVLKLKVARDPDRALQVHRNLTDKFYALKREDRTREATEVGRRRRQLNKLAPLRHSYASTVHKSQGSTYDAALVDYSDISKARDMRARLMYVAASRPSEYLVFAHGGWD